MVENNILLIDFLLENLNQMYDYVVIEDGFEVAKGGANRIYADNSGEFLASKVVVSILPSFFEDGTIEVEVESVEDAMGVK